MHFRKKEESYINAACGVTFPDPDTSHHMTPAVTEEGVKRRENQQHMGMIPNTFSLFLHADIYF